MKSVTKFLGVLLVLLVCNIGIVEKASAQVAIVEVIKAGVKKVIKAVDLKIQRLQNQTIWLQNAQKTAENILSQTKLTEIGDWVERQRTLYHDYYDELYKVKAIISYYQRIRAITEKQVQIVKAYKRAWGLLQKDKHFSAAELDYMAKVYSGILDETVANVDQIMLVVNSFKTQMSDAKRMEIINDAADQVDINYDALIQFNEENMILSLQRSKDVHESELVKKMYGIQ